MSEDSLGLDIQNPTPLRKPVSVDISPNGTDIIRKTPEDTRMINGVELIPAADKLGLSADHRRVLVEMGAMFYPKTLQIEVPAISAIPVVPDEIKDMELLGMLEDADIAKPVEIRALYNYLVNGEAIFDKHGKDDMARDNQRQEIHSRTVDDPTNPDSKSLAIAYEQLNVLKKNKISVVLEDLSTISFSGLSSPYLSSEQGEAFISLHRNVINLREDFNGENGAHYDDMEMSDKLEFIKNVNSAIVTTLNLTFEGLPVERKSIMTI